MEHKAGFVNIIGSPNVGKSTLMNALVGEKLSIITPKEQTTRHRIIGIVNGDNFQIIFSDTPGIIKPAYKLQESMMGFVKSAFDDADIFIYMVDIKEKEFKNEAFCKKIINTNKPLILLLNKIDKSTPDEVKQKLKFWKNKISTSFVYVISALECFNIDSVFNKIIELLPSSPPYYPKDQLTDKSERFFVNEIIREKILYRYKKEIPYSVEVETEKFDENDDIIKIRSIIIVERETQKGIIIGHKGNPIKKVGISSRKDLERFFKKKVFLELYVKVNKNWRTKEKCLKDFGYKS